MPVTATNIKYGTNGNIFDKPVDNTMKCGVVSCLVSATQV